MKKILIIVSAALLAFSASAQDLEIRLENRNSLNFTSVAGQGVQGPETSVDRLSLAINWKISDKLRFEYFQHFNRPFNDKAWLSSADWLNLTYAPGEHLFFRAGKIISMYGSFEYFEAPINVYFYSRHYLTGRFFVPGVEAGYIFNQGKDIMIAQVTAGKFSEPGNLAPLSYNLCWLGFRDRLNLMYSVNYHEHPAGSDEIDVLLGHSISLDKVSIKADFGHRAYVDRNENFFKSWFVVPSVAYDVLPWMTLQAKAAYDHDAIIGDEMHFGGGLEFFPIHGDRIMRLHMMADYIPQTKMTTFGVGIKFNCHILTK